MDALQDPVPQSEMPYLSQACSANSPPSAQVDVLTLISAPGLPCTSKHVICKPISHRIWNLCLALNALTDV